MSTTAIDVQDLNAVLSRAITQRRELATFVDVCLAGLHHATGATGAIDLNRRIAAVLRQPDPFPDETVLEEHKARAKVVEDFAKEEVRKGFPYLFGLAIVRLWSIVEVMVEDLAIAILRRSDLVPPTGPLGELRGPLLPFLGASTQERAERILAALQEKCRATFRPGAAAFEAVLEPLGVSGSIEESIRKCLIELAGVRNVILHRHGVVDTRLAQSCPWVGWQAGNSVNLTRNHFHMYGLAVNWYIVELFDRVGRKWAGEGVQQAARDVQVGCVERIAQFQRTRPAGL
jgi:hypothetical protein